MAASSTPSYPAQAIYCMAVSRSQPANNTELAPNLTIEKFPFV